jgi:hypothetical protein
LGAKLKFWARFWACFQVTFFKISMLLCRGGSDYSSDEAPNIVIRSKYSNMYVAFATIPDHKSYRNKKGTRYIQTFCDILDDKDLTNTKQMVDLLNEVSDRLSTVMVNDNKYSQTTDLRIIGLMRQHWYMPIRK